MNFLINAVCRLGENIGKSLGRLFFPDSRAELNSVIALSQIWFSALLKVAVKVKSVSVHSRSSIPPFL